MKKSKKAGIAAGILPAVLLAAVTGQKIYAVNTRYPQAKIQYIPCGETREIKSGLTMRICKKEWLSGRDYIKKYGKAMDVTSDENSMILLLDVEIRNPGDQENQMDLSELYLEEKGYSQGISLENFVEFNDGMLVRLKPEEKTTAKLFYQLEREQFTEEQWKRIEQENFYLVNQRYPEKIEWYIQ